VPKPAVSRKVSKGKRLASCRGYAPPIADCASNALPGHLPTTEQALCRAIANLAQSDTTDRLTRSVRVSLCAVAFTHASDNGLPAVCMRVLGENEPGKNRDRHSQEVQLPVLNQKSSPKRLHCARVGGVQELHHTPFQT